MKFAGARGITRSRVPIIAMLALAATIGLAGCEGDDGKDGADSTVPGPVGPAGPTGPAGPSVGVQKPLESCAVCHGEDSFLEAAVAHEITGQPSVSNVVIAPAGADLVVTYNLKVDGVNDDAFTILRSDYRFDGVDRIDTGDPLLVSEGSGNYRITVPGGAADAVNSRYLFRVANAPSNPRINAVVVADIGDAPVALVTDQSCGNCHGADISAHYGYQAGASQCIVCHDAANVQADPTRPAPPFFTLIHGVHNSHNMPSGEFVWGSDTFSVTYPTYMNNCSVCHQETDQLAAANALTVTWEGCMSCHESMESWDFSVETGNGFTFHETMNPATNCAQQCHAPAAQGGFAPATAAEMHNGSVTERGGIIWNGEDTSVVEGAKFAWKIDGIVDDGTNLAISWSATYNAVAVNPCNTTVAANAPVFHARTGSNLSMLRSYAQGGDFIIGTADAPGQANAVNVTTTNTTCAGNVATTTIPVDDVDATVGRVALQGKPWVVNADPAATGPMQVRAKTPTFDWMLGSGTAATPRRAIADSSKCVTCHVGSLYQHGGNRVDNVDMCILCHNSASNEQNVRVGMGVDASEAYDGRAGQTFEFKSMLHLIHSRGAEGASPIVIYRNRGIYAWAPEGTTLPNWPGTGSQPVFGSADANGQPVMQNHNFHSPTYPRPTNDCGACHTAGFDDVPDQATAMATTLEAGEEPWGNQVDDVLQGAGAAACTSCHSSSDAKGHAYQNSWTPQTFENGRQTIIDATK